MERGTPMNKRSIACLVALSVLCQQLCASRTFFSVPVPFHPASPERLTMTHNQVRDFVYEHNDGLWALCFGGRSTSPERLASYFFPFDKSCVRTGGFGSQSVQNHTADMLVHYFDVLTGVDYKSESITNIFDAIPTWTFESNLSICPVHSFYGVGFVYHRHLSENHHKGFWLEIALPIMGVKNDLRMCEQVITPDICDEPLDTSFFATPDSSRKAYQCMTAALRSSNFQYGKIDSRVYKQTKWGVPDLEAHLGYTYCRTPQYHLSSYAGVLLPTGNAPSATYLFEKIIGYNNHTGFFLGTRGGITFWQHNENKLSAELETSQTIFLDNIEIRSFDLYNGQWSRYIWVYPKNNDRSYLAPGINYFTKSMYVSHGSLRHLNLAATYNTHNFQGELGYHCYMRGEEGVRLVKPWCAEPALAALWYSNNQFISSQGRRVSRSAATINNYTNIYNDTKELSATLSESNDTYVPVQESQLNLESATHPAIVVHAIYGSVGYGWYDLAIPTFLDIAGSYNFGYGNAVLDYWKLWFKLGIAF